MTDGYGCSVSFFRAKGSAQVLADLEAADFADWERPYLRIWGADPGVTDVFVASDGGEFLPNEENALQRSRPHEVRQFSTVEFYTKAQYKHSTICVQNWKMRSQVLDVEQNIVTSKAINLRSARLFITGMLASMERLLTFYDQRFTKLRFRRFVKNQQTLSELANVFITGGQKYDQITAEQKSRQIAEHQRRSQSSSMENVQTE
ncbi:uncharacterized protein BYT42DRAFT_178216 [Radiomyces spectabilis]|uniref:uncharacterized protein n=1 Tax=Radiomyces spectabilis TaxID=64574 RepID=UPI00221FF944|nr:uncharacterized protein BYT42DRAFT_178216 [Radiomyces spectabilis]KAI8391000.1 hypothetical protein BYT42DRAFT_178216 [Radiomyces spectabilis]